MTGRLWSMVGSQNPRSPVLARGSGHVTRLPFLSKTKIISELSTWEEFGSAAGMVTESKTSAPTEHYCWAKIIKFFVHRTIYKTKEHPQDIPRTWHLTDVYTDLSSIKHKWRRLIKWCPLNVLRTSRGPVLHGQVESRGRLMGQCASWHLNLKIEVTSLGSSDNRIKFEFN